MLLLISGAYFFGKHQAQSRHETAAEDFAVDVAFDGDAQSVELLALNIESGKINK